MGNENLWYLFAALFGAVAVLHVVRALKASGGRRNAGFAMAGAAVVWGATAIIFRFYSFHQALVVGLGAVGLMMLAAVYSGRLK